MRLGRGEAPLQTTDGLISPVTFGTDLIAAGLGIGVVPLAACSAQVRVLGLKVVRLSDALGGAAG